MKRTTIEKIALTGVSVVALLTLGIGAI